MEKDSPTSLRFPPGLKAKATAAAQADGRKLSGWIINLVRLAVAKEGKKK